MDFKKDIPNLLQIEVPYDREIIEDTLLERYYRIIKEGYAFSFKDMDVFSAILLKRMGVEGVPEVIRKYATINGIVIERIRFEMIRLAVEQLEEITDDDVEFYIKYLGKRVLERKKIVKKEVGRVINNFSQINIEKNTYYRKLLTIIHDFDDLTLIDWFIPIKLTFERFVHIYVKHVEETKFGEGKFKKRSFFDYKHTEILTLLKVVLKQEEQDIKDHFLFLSIENSKSEKLRDYHRGFGKFPKLIFDNYEFRLSIDKNGFIQTFYQNK